MLWFVRKGIAPLSAPVERVALRGGMAGVITVAAAIEAFICTVFVLGIDPCGANVLVSFLGPKPNM
jgi:hypothetical protein